jgi:hypothetical protein
VVDTSNLSTILRACWTEKEWKKVQQVTDIAAWFYGTYCCSVGTSIFKDGFKLFTYQ